MVVFITTSHSFLPDFLFFLRLCHFISLSSMLRLPFLCLFTSHIFLLAFLPLPLSHRQENNKNQSHGLFLSSLVHSLMLSFSSVSLQVRQPVHKICIFIIEQIKAYIHGILELMSKWNSECFCLGHRFPLRLWHLSAYWPVWNIMCFTYSWFTVAFLPCVCLSVDGEIIMLIALKLVCYYYYHFDTLASHILL